MEIKRKKKKKKKKEAKKWGTCACPNEEALQNKNRVSHGEHFYKSSG